MHEVLVSLKIKRVRLRKIKKAAVHLFEIPGIFKLDEMLADFCLGRSGCNIGCEQIGQLGVLSLVQQLNAANHEIFVLTNCHARAPLVPTVGADPSIENGSDETD